ncbi:MAG: 50S ribosomal protein L20 [Candidatus Lloydbacteria bacterium RIFCSPHIGHO2_02_FULL_54_17]|uniref:Large ribosomal subunit protein bL20 n=1 Tax=Candidatus Lloydbacteria bacterium RIFCSPHIGHO2_02_FULL_54_17 TaxID=1798664 RepID=A0A1G2DH05_9BACT|nr:MAG: 50S ribosomal protein L20 [Candidatus Lloydbacteria bacterium RIFCSPHIGHO2_01_FULL_54_11]OGZ12068.1 MAG: 50S ribosomal protein L20 [Candidatus Lloydbacteria bacterium RIFCSPHIGHO2_02_FULL_54_17]OGZ13399.1 MAG: 50S ribosomal protein L20 [Candidatus Lloydbacteria bacterium RIFCSPLOWO2_01_FULL_54_18]OGZ15761.1 MAG: 50S ribosomal protein L20 [Candidatus Lloydbacteria bacterium RIFCSPLOWO2_02_FULL_54_12]
MSRVKRGTTSNKRRRNVLRAAKGYRFGRSKKEVEAKVALRKAGSYAFAHRKDKKNDFRRMWQVKINAGLRPLGYSYSKFIGTALKKKILLDRKILATLAEHNPDTFARVAKEVMT